MENSVTEIVGKSQLLELVRVLYSSGRVLDGCMTGALGTEGIGEQGICPLLGWRGQLLEVSKDEVVVVSMEHVEQFSGLKRFQLWCDPHSMTSLWQSQESRRLKRFQCECESHCTYFFFPKICIDSRFVSNHQQVQDRASASLEPASVSMLEPSNQSVPPPNEARIPSR